MRAEAGDKKQSNRSAVSHSAAAATNRPNDRETVVTITNYQPPFSLLTVLRAVNIARIIAAYARRRGKCFGV